MRLTRSVVFTLGLLLCLLSTPLLAAPCATVGLSVSPPIASPGQIVALSASIANCSGQLEIVAAKYTISGPGFSYAFTLFLPLGANLDATHTFTFPAPYRPGIYTISVSLSSRGVELSRATATLTVVS